MNFISFLIVVFLCKIFVSETIAWDENSLSRTVTTRNHRRLKGFTFNTFHSASLVSCGLKCQRNPRCVSTNFRKVTSSDETEGVCALNDKGVESPIEGKELQYDEQTVYSQFSDMKHDCQLTGCLNTGSCEFIKASKGFKCKCKEAWSGSFCADVKHCVCNPCQNGGSCSNLAEDYKCSCIAGYTGRQCEQVCPVPLGMENGTILDSQISASSVFAPNHAAQQARLHFKAGGGKTGSWSAEKNDDSQWLQVDLQQTTSVTGIATQGRNAYRQWVTQYKLQYGKDGHIFKFYRQNGNHSDTIFQGNTDSDSVVFHDLSPIIQARYIRLRPTQWYQHISMRMELYTC